MTRQEYITRHLEICQAKPIPVYDKDKPGKKFKSLAYSRRKCAAANWRKGVREGKWG